MTTPTPPNLSFDFNFPSRISCQCNIDQSNPSLASCDCSQNVTIRNMNLNNFPPNSTQASQQYCMAKFPNNQAEYNKCVESKIEGGLTSFVGELFNWGDNATKH